MRFGPGKRFVIAGVASCALLVLGTAGASAAKPQASGDSQVTLTVTITGPGIGVVTSTPQGIDCATTCSAQFPVDSDVRLVAQSVSGSTFGGSGSTFGSWTAGGAPTPCGSDKGANVCDWEIAGDTALQATFNAKPPPCIAPGVTYTNLVTAKKIIQVYHCKLGKITYAFSKKEKGRILAQNPKAHWHLENGAIDLLVSKGER